MNTSSAVETKIPFSFKETLFKTIPKNIVGHLLFWGALPVVLLLFTIGVSFLCIASFSLYFPFLTLLSGILCLRWKTIGLYGSYLALSFLVFSFFQDIPREERLWQMGVIFALAVDYFILLLAIEEIETIINRIAEVGRVKAKDLNQSQLQLQQLNREKDEQQQRLEEEINQLKEEAEQRRIEKQQESKRVELIHSEIELLTSQKESFVAEARKARAILENVKEKKETTTLNSGVTDEVSLKQTEGLYKQLRSQFDEKARVLSQTRKELFQTQSKLLALQHEQFLSQLSPDREETVFYEKELNVMISEVHCLEEEVFILEELVSHSHFP